MKYILDSSVGFKWAVVEALTDKARLLRDDYCNAVHELFSPDVFAIEVAHGLTKAERQARISPTQAGILWKDVMKTAPILIPTIPLIPRAHEIASQFRIGIYDCVYVALAESEKCEFSYRRRPVDQQPPIDISLHSTPGVIAVSIGNSIS